jgi:signal transduction histidine kinase
MRTRQVDTLHALDRASQTSDTLGDFAVQVLDVAMSGWEAHAGGLFLYEGATQTWTCRARRGLGCDMTDPRFDLALQLAHQAQASGRPIVIPDVDPTGRLDLLSVAAAPLVAEGQIVGALFLGAKRRHALAERQAELLATAAHQIALAVSNAQLYAKVSQMAVFEERYRLSREIHDGLAQTLAYLGLQTERLEKLMASGRSQAAAAELSEMRQSIRAAYVDAREAIDGLRLSMDNPEQLSARLADYAAEFSRQTGIAVHFATEPTGLTTDPAIALQLLRITQEALTNVRKHALAHRVDIRLRSLTDELELTVTDDGHGFPDILQPDGGARRYGLATMRERAEGLGGMFTIATGPGQGTRITVAIPL